MCRVILGSVASVLAPADCRACGGPLLQIRSYAVCDACLGRLQPDNAPGCARCGEWLDLDDARGHGFARSEPLCHACDQQEPPFANASAFAAYEGSLRQLIRLHKFEGMQELAVPLGALLVSALQVAVQALPSGPVHVIAVPLFRSRRRYNQSRQIAAAALRSLRREGGAMHAVESHAALRRVRATESQSQLSPAQRRDNVRGAFQVAGPVDGWNVVLVDDVYTTGATAAECTRTLLRAGAAAVHVVTLARTQPERVTAWAGEPGRSGAVWYAATDSQGASPASPVPQRTPDAARSAAMR